MGIYNLRYTKEIIKLKEDFEKCSKVVEQASQFQQHNIYQFSVAQVISQKKEDYIIAEMPTGSGKTWVQAFLALITSLLGKMQLLQRAMRIQKIKLKNYCQIQAMIFLLLQQSNFYIPLRMQLSLQTTTIYTQKITIQSRKNNITGLRQLLNRKVYFFTATTNKSIEKIIKNIFQKLIVLKYKSEYIMVNMCRMQVKALQNVVTQKMTYYIFQNKMCYILLMSNQQLYFANKKDKSRFLICFKKWVIIRKLIRNQNLEIWSILLRQVDSLGQTADLLLIQLSQSPMNYRVKQSIYAQGEVLDQEAYVILYHVVSRLSPLSIVQNLRNNQRNKFQYLERLLKVIWCKRTTKFMIETIQDAEQQEEEKKPQRIQKQQQVNKSIPNQQKYRILILREL